MSRYLGSTKDLANHPVDVYTDDISIILLYNEGLVDEVETQRTIEEIKSHPDDYLYTPFVEFVDLF